MLKPGQSIEAAGYTLTYTGLKAANGPNYTGFRALLDVRRGGSRVASLDPGQNNYAIEGPATEASIYHDLRSIGDVFTTAQLVKGSPNIDLKVFVKPLVNLIWVAGFVFVAGALIAMWPDAVEQRRLAARYAAGAAPAGI